jgi:hypothetical protein
VVFDNRLGLFPIHRGLRFAALTATHGAPDDGLRCRFGVTDPATLDPEAVRPGAVQPVILTRAALERLSGPALTIPDLPTATDLRLVDTLVVRHPPLSDQCSWGATFGRELNATEDADCLRPVGRRGAQDGLPVIEGKHVSPYRVDLRAVSRVAEATATRARLGARAAAIDRPRIAYRDVASATNRRTLIAAIVPGGVVTVHTLFCLRTVLMEDAQQVLCALMNSYVANYLARRWVTTHVTTRVVERLPVPWLPPAGELFRSMAEGAERMGTGDTDTAGDTEVVLQAQAAEAYGLTVEEFAHVLETFPLIAKSARDSALALFTARRLPQSR